MMGNTNVLTRLHSLCLINVTHTLRALHDCSPHNCSHNWQSHKFLEFLSILQRDIWDRNRSGTFSRTRLKSPVTLQIFCDAMIFERKLLVSQMKYFLIPVLYEILLMEDEENEVLLE